MSEHDERASGMTLYRRGVLILLTMAVFTSGVGLGTLLVLLTMILSAPVWFAVIGVVLAIVGVFALLATTLVARNSAVPVERWYADADATGGREP